MNCFYKCINAFETRPHACGVCMRMNLFPIRFEFYNEIIKLVQYALDFKLFYFELDIPVSIVKALIARIMK